MFLAMLAGWAAQPAHATVLWEDYQGTFAIGNDSTAGPNYNNQGYAVSVLTGLRTLAANPGINAVRTGNSANIDFNAASRTLCDTTGPAPVDTNQVGCQLDVMGRVVYAMIRYPQAGNFVMSVAHDDQIDMDISSSYTSTNYRTATYDIPVGSAASFTANDTTFETLSTVNVAAANRCGLIRIFWNNAGGVNHLRLRWTRPDNVTEIVPAAQLFDPSNPASASGCSGSVQGTGNALVLNKAVTGRANPNDQFTISILNNATAAVLAETGTGGSGTGQQASTGAIVTTNGVTYRLTDAMSGGSTATLSSYTPTIACTRNGTAFTPAGSAPNWTVTPTSSNDQMVCTITNAPNPVDLSITKTNTPGAGASDQASDTVTGGTATTYQIVVRNNAAGPVTGAVVTDTPNASLDCPNANAVSCTSSGGGCPASGLTIGNLKSPGLTLGTVPGGGTVTLGLICTPQ